MTNSLIIAVDGPAASGKGTIARRLAAHFSFPHLNTGILYRLVGARIIHRKGDYHNFENELDSLLQDLLPAYSKDIDFDVSEELATSKLMREEVSQAASAVARSEALRAGLFSLQRDFVLNAKQKFGGVVIEGRDTTTVICPEANYKFFVTAEVEVRAQRRFSELKRENLKRNLAEPDFAQVLANIKSRDESDQNRKIAPLKIAEGAIVIDNSKLTAEESFRKALGYIDELKFSRKLDEKLLSILVCPLSKETLIYDEKNQELVCASSKLAYPIIDGIPLMLIDRARKISEQ